jgi:ketosteroid isomerase-like protein
MSKENVELVRAVYERYARGDFSYFDEFDDEFEVVTTPDHPDSGTYRGRAAQHWMRDWVASFDHLTIEATEIIDAGDKIVVAIRQRSRPHGSRTVMEGRWWQVVTVRTGKAARLETYTDKASALEAAGLSE